MLWITGKTNPLGGENWGGVFIVNEAYPEHLSHINGAAACWQTTVVECNEFRKRQVLMRRIRTFAVSFGLVACRLECGGMETWALNSKIQLASTNK
jgi:hypothetical protein